MDWRSLSKFAGAHAAIYDFSTCPDKPVNCATQVRQAIRLYEARTLGILPVLQAPPADNACSISQLAKTMDERIGTVSARIKLLLHARLIIQHRQVQLAIYSVAHEHAFRLIREQLQPCPARISS